jgi:hypothetical protein
VQPLAVDLVLLRATAPELPLAVGRILSARVVERHGERHGILNLAGAIVTAELPEDVQEGDRLRLAIRELSSDRVVLQHLPPQAPPPLTAAFGELRVALADPDGESGSEGEEHVVALRCESAALGVVELRLALGGGVLTARVALDAGDALERGRAHAEALRSALSAASGVPAEVEIVPRRESLDVYA